MLSVFQCGSLTFPGPAPHSEPETQAIDELMRRYRPNIRAYITVHSFGDMVLYPWGYAGSPGLIGNHAYHHEVGLLWRNAIQAQTGKVYAVGNTAALLGNAFGCSDDHVINILFLHSSAIVRQMIFCSLDGRQSYSKSCIHT